MGRKLFKGNNLSTMAALLVVLSSSPAAAAEAQRPRILFDTDITGDVDDVLALAMLHTLADAGHCDLLGVTVSKSHPLTAKFVDAINTFYGRPDLPIGIGKDAPARESKYLKLVQRTRAGHPIPRLRYDTKSNADAESALRLLRKTLASQPDHSVTVVQVGLAYNIARLLDSPADEISPLTGFDLVRSKVRQLSVMAGAFQPIRGSRRYLEANVRNHVASMKSLAEDWPLDVPVVWSGFEIGIAAPYPRTSIRNDFLYAPFHPVREAYLLHSGPEHDRPSWDLTSVLFAVFPEDRTLFGLSEKGAVTVADDGYTSHQKKTVGRDVYLTMSAAQQRKVVAQLRRWVSEPPSVGEPDIILRGGLIHTGDTNADPFAGDVAIRGDEIIGIGKFHHRGAPWIIPCQDHVISPGFIDLHNHSDRGIVTAESRANANFLTQGCTTIVTGNCGSGPVDVAAYYEKLDKQGAGTNVAHLIPQGSLREKVIGSARRKADDGEMKAMLRLAHQAMRDGAWGMSTGLIYVPSSYADTDELVALATAVAEHDGIYASHMRGEGTSLLSSVDELLEIGQRAKLPVHISHFKSSGRDAWGLVREAVRKVDAARAAGQVVTADQYPYIASSTSLSATIIPSKERAGGRKAMLNRLDDPQTGPAIQKRMARSIAKANDGAAIRIAMCSSKPQLVGLSLAQAARRENTTPLALALEIERGGGARIVNFSMNEEDVRFVMQTPWVATASDGRTYTPGADRPHPRYYGTFPRKIGHYAVGEKVLPLAKAVRSATGLPADILQLHDRGYLDAGMKADIVVFHPDKIRDRATFDDPHQYCDGIQHVLVNGKLAIHRGAVTGVLAGRPLRKP